MERLTAVINVYHKENANEEIVSETLEYDLKIDTSSEKQKCIQKLGELEDLEEQIGMPLDIYVKIRRLNICSVFTVSLLGKVEKREIYIRHIDSFSVLNANYSKITHFDYKDYNDKWFVTYEEALRKLEELQKDKEGEYEK